MLKEKRMDADFRRRLRRRLYCGDLADLDTPSLPLTGLAVDYFHDSIPDKLGQVDLFTASNVVKRNRVSPCSMVLSMLYAKRLRQKNQEYLQTMSSSDVFFISVMMASKYMYDEGVDEEVFNDEWADNSNQDVDDVNQMEIDFLQALDWRLFVRPEEFENTLAAIEKRLAMQEGMKRGWFTYSELDILMNSDFIGMMWTQVGVECSKLVATMSAAYLTSLLSLLGSTAIAVQLSVPLSSATVTLLSIQSAPLINLFSSELPPVDTSIFLASQNQGPGNTRHHLSLGSSDLMDGNVTGLTDNVVKNDEGLMLGNVNKELKKVEVEWKRARMSEEADDDGGSGDNPAKPSTSSLWSLLFLDSLLSQLWTVTGIGSKLMHSLGGAFSEKSGGHSSAGQEDSSKSHLTGAKVSSSPCCNGFRQRQRVCRHCKQQHAKNLKGHESTTHTAEFVSNTNEDLELDNLGSITPDTLKADHHICSACFCSHQIADPLNTVRPDTCKRLLSDKDFQSYIDPLILAYSPEPQVNSYRPSQTDNQLNPSKNLLCQHCCQGPGIRHDKNGQGKSSNHYPAVYPDLMRIAEEDYQTLPHLQTSNDLLKVPLGFFTGALLAT